MVNYFVSFIRKGHKNQIFSREVQRSVRRDKIEFAIAVDREAEDCANRRFLKNVNIRLLTHDDEQQVLRTLHDGSYRITSGEVPPLMDEMANHRNMRIRTVPPSRREIISPIRVLNGVKSLGLTVPQQSYLSLHLQLLLPEGKNGMIVKIPKKWTRFECHNWRGIHKLPTVAKIIARMILGRTKEHLENLIASF